MSKHGPRYRQPPPTPVPAPPFMPKPGPGVLRGGAPSSRERSWLFAVVVIASAAALIAIFFAGFAAGVASHG